MSNEFNLPLLRKAVEWAESEARKPIEESQWAQEWIMVAGLVLDRTCGTAYCIAGWTAFEAGHDFNSPEGVDACELARDLLGITMQEAWNAFDDKGLFSANNTIEDVRRYAERIAHNHGEEL